MSQPEAKRARDLARVIGTVDLEDPSPVLPAVLPRLQTLLRAEAVCAYGVEQGAAQLALQFFEERDMPFGGAAAFCSFIARQPRWASFNPLRPEPWQRGEVITFADMDRRGLDVAKARRDLSGVVGLGLMEDQIRALICDGPVLLAWIGGFRREPFGEAERALFSRLVGPLQRRLKLERHLAETGLRGVALAAALEAIPAASFVIAAASGGVVHANAAGKAWLAADRRSATQALADTVAGRASEVGFTLTELVATGVTKHYLAIMKAGPADPRSRVATLAPRIGLTPRQSEVLALLARGCANKTIAATLGCTEATVEVHVGKLLEKAQVESRAALVAWFWTAE